jgi:ribonuclease VapC
VVVDTSALLAIVVGEPDMEEVAEALAHARDPVMSSASLVEASIVLLARVGPRGVDHLDALIEAAGIRVVAVDDVQARAAREAFGRFGRGRHPAALNYGDCFPYALAATHGRPLLYVGQDFARTDVVPARTPPLP